MPVWLQDPAQRLLQLERDNQQLRRELDHVRKLLAAPDRPALDAALESGLQVRSTVCAELCTCRIAVGLHDGRRGGHKLLPPVRIDTHFPCAVAALLAVCCCCCTGAEGCEC